MRERKENANNQDGLPERIASGFGMDQFGQNLFSAVAISYITYLCTDVALLSAVQMGIVLTVSRILDAGLTVVISGMVQRARLKGGKYRPWLILWPVGAFCFTFLEMIAWKFSPALARMVLIGVGYTGASAMVTLASCTQIGLITLLGGASQKKRLHLTIRYTQFDAISEMLVSAAVLPLIQWFASFSDMGTGFLVISMVFNLINIGIHLALYRVTAEFREADTASSRSEKKQRITIREMLRQTVSNGPLLALMAIMFLSMIAVYIISGLSSYYFIYVAGDLTLYALYSSVSAAFKYIGALIISPFVGKIGKRRCFCLTYFLLFCSYLVIAVWGRNWKLFIAMGAVRGLINPLVGAWGSQLWIDAGEYGYHKNGKDARVFLASLQNLPFKIGVLFSTVLVSGVLYSVHYTAGMEATPEFLDSLVRMLGGGPAVCYGLIFLIFFFGYRITDEKAQEYAEKNAKRG